MSMTAPSTATSSGCARSSARWILNSTRSRPCMASAIDTARPDPPPQDKDGKRPWGRSAPAPEVDEAEDEVDHAWRWPRFSRLARLIVTLNLLGLLILVSGALVLNELRRGLVIARLESLS